MGIKLLICLALLCGWPACCPVLGQEPQSFPDAKSASLPTYDALPQIDFANLHISLMPEIMPSYMPAGFTRNAWKTAPNTIGRMEAAFYCNDTPFVDQVRFPLATFWNGRVKLTGFESDVTTANFVLGLPGQGSLHNLSAFGNAFIATHTPRSDQLAGINMTISLHPRDVDAFDNSGRRGIEYLVKASRGFLPFLSSRTDSITFTAR